MRDVNLVSATDWRDRRATKPAAPIIINETKVVWRESAWTSREGQGVTPRGSGGGGGGAGGQVKTLKTGDTLKNAAHLTLHIE